MRQSSSRSLLWALLESGGLSLLSLVVLLMIARLVGPADLGAFAIAMGIVQLLTTTVEMLMHDAIVQRREIVDDHLQTAFWICLGLGFAFSALCWFAAPWIGAVFDIPNVEPLLAMLAFGIVFSAAGSVPVAILRRDLRFKPLALRSLYGRLGGALAAIALAVAGGGVWSLVAQHLVQIALCMLLLWPAITWRPRLRFSAARAGELLSFGLFAVGSRIVWLSNIRLFTLLVGYLLGAVAVGYLNIALRVVDTLYDLIAGAASNFALPLFSRRQDDRVALMRAYLTATELAALSIPPVFAGLALCAPAIVTVILGEQWLPAAPLIRILAASAALQFILLFAHTTITAMGRPGALFGLSLVSLGFVLIALAIVQPTDAFDASVIWVSRIAVSGPVLFIIVYRLLRLTPSAFIDAVGRPVAATLAMVAALLLVERYFLEGLSAATTLLVMVPLGVTIYGAAVAITARRAVGRLTVFLLDGLRGARAS